MNNFPWWVQKISPRTQTFHVKISSRKVKFETLYPNDIIKLEIIKGIVMLCLRNHFFTKINKNLKDIRRNTFFNWVSLFAEILHSWYPLNFSPKDSTEVEVLMNYCQIRRVQTQGLEGIFILGTIAPRTNYTVFQQKQAV